MTSERVTGIKSESLTTFIGISTLPPSDSNYADITRSLQILKYSVKSKGFREEDSFLLRSVYGGKACYKGGYLMRLFNKGCEQAKDESGKGSEEVELTRRVFLETLDKEIASFRKLAELHHARDVEISEPLKDSHLIPSQEDLDKVMRYEAALERQFERKVQQLVAWRRAKGVPATIEGAAVWSGGRKGST
jgi:hypothetical protein